MSVKSEESNRKTNLIVNYLPQSLTDEHFRVLFAKHGDIRSARIIRNKTSGYSYGFGFVDYFNAEDADRAIENLNGSEVNQKKIKVSYARPSGDEIKNANLYVTNLPPNFAEKDVRSMFAKYGEIIQCRLVGNHSGIAFVLFNLNEQAKSAMKSLNGQLIPGTSHKVSIKLATNEQKKSLRQEGSSFNGHSLSQSVHSHKRSYSSSQDNQLSYPVSKFAAQSHKPSGPIRNSSHSNRYNPMSHQAQFYPHPSPMPVDLPPLYPDPMHGGAQPYMKMDDYYSPPAPPPPHHFNGNGADHGEHILFVYNIGPETNEYHLGQLFSDFGPVTRVNVIRRGNSGESRGYGFVTMKYYQDALGAINSLDGQKYITNKPLQVSFKKM